MKKIIMLTVLLFGCSRNYTTDTTPVIPGVFKFRDENVVCYLFKDAISCVNVPETGLKQKSTAEQDRIDEATERQIELYSKQSPKECISSCLRDEFINVQSAKVKCIEACPGRK